MLRRMRQQEAGAVFVEAAIVLPVLLLIVTATIQFGYFFSLLSSLRNASMLAARSAVLGTDLSSAEVCETARRALASTLDSSKLTCSTIPQILPAATNSPVTIYLSYPVPVIARFGEIGSAGVWVARSEATMQ